MRVSASKALQPPDTPAAGLYPSTGAVVSSLRCPRPLSVSELRQAAARYYSPASLSTAWGEHLSRFAWDWFTTLTFKRSVSAAAADYAWRDFCKWLRQDCGHRCEWFRVAELQSRGAIHLHALMGDCANVRRLSAMDYWFTRYGIARVVPYDPARGARYYLCQYVAKDYRESDLELLCETSRNLKRLLMSG